MTTSVSIARCALLALAASLLLLAPASASAATTAELRVLTPNRVLDDGTNYAIQDPIRVPTRPGADCFGPPGGSGAEYEYEKPVALGLLASGARARSKLRPISLTDQFGFGLALCGIGGAEADSESFWYLKRNHEEASLGIDQLRVSNGDQILLYLAPDNFPEPNPAELELRSPARAQAGEPFEVEVIEHACTTDQETFEVRCAKGPAEGATVRGGGAEAITGADGTAQVDAGSGKQVRLVASRGSDIPSQRLEVCVDADPRDCPKAFGERYLGSKADDRLKGGRGPDRIRARGGRDRINLRRGGEDRVNCGGGRDEVVVKRRDRDDRIARNCERVKRR